MTTNREWLNITAEEYHLYPAVSSGGLKCYEKKGPLEYHAMYIAKTKLNEDTTAKRMGTAFHKAMEDPDSWQTGYVLRPTEATDALLIAKVEAMISEHSSAEAPKLGEKLNMRKKFHKAYVELMEQEAVADGKVMLTSDEYDIIDLQIAAVYDNVVCREVVGQKTRTNVEMACVAECSKTGVMIKALTDLLVGDVIVDFKTTKAANAYEFCRDAMDMGYRFQAAHYLHVTGCTEFRFLSVTSQASLKTGSHCEANLWRVPDKVIREAHEKNIQTLGSIKSNLKAAGDDTMDCQGVPYAWHNNDWNAELPLDTNYFLNDELDPELVGF